MDKPLKIYGTPDENTLEQMHNAMRLEPVVAGALMPDAHLGYGLPIGGVLACKEAVIPYAVGFDIGCRVHMSLLAMPVEVLDSEVERERILDVVDECTRFGVGASFAEGEQRQHPVLDDPLWEKLDKRGIVSFDTVKAQLGTSGSGNHFVDIGVVTMNSGNQYLAILSHSGSRAVGHKICSYYAALASEQHPEGGELAWLDLHTEEGIGYWNAMQLAGRYAEANHECIHEAIINGLSAVSYGSKDNHHNFAWIEDGMVVHRKGATPAHDGVVGLIPGTMTDDTYIVKGLGNPESINSSSHGAGREMSRKGAKRTLCRDEWASLLEEKGVTLRGGDLDEAPGAYKNIEEVMAYQSDLVSTLGVFTPKLVRMA